MIIAVRGNEAFEIAGLDIFNRDFPFAEERPCCKVAFGLVGENTVGCKFTLMTVKLPGLRSATEDGKGPVIAGGLQRTGPDDGAGAPRAMQKGGAPVSFSASMLASSRLFGRLCDAGMVNSRYSAVGRTSKRRASPRLSR